MANKNLLITLILFMSSLIFGSIAGWLYYQQINIERNGLATEGTVIDLVESTDSDGTTYAPIVRFKTQSGRAFEFQSKHYSYPPQYEIGEKVTVLYLPEKPAEAIVKDEGQLLIIIFTVLSGLELIMSAIFGIKTLNTIFQGES